MIRAIREFIDFSYLIRREVIDEDVLDAIDGCIERFHRYRECFKAMNVLGKRGFNLPRQHSLVHYRSLIQQFGAPNGLSTSIMESKHKESVKNVWRRSNRYNATEQMAKMVERTEKMKAQRVQYERAKMITAKDRRPTKRRRQSALDEQEHIVDNGESSDEDGEGDTPCRVRVGHSSRREHEELLDDSYACNHDVSSTASLPKIPGKHGVAGGCSNLMRCDTQ